VPAYSGGATAALAGNWEGQAAPVMMPPPGFGAGMPPPPPFMGGPGPPMGPGMAWKGQGRREGGIRDKGANVGLREALR